MYYVCRFDSGFQAIPVASFDDLEEAKEYAKANAGDFCSGLEVLDEDGLWLDFASERFKDVGFEILWG